MSVETSKKREAAKAKIEASASELNRISQEIWSNPELCYKEHHAHKVLTDFLEKEGFEVTRNYLGLETAFKATYGSEDGVHVCVMCEYDALPDIGHACGHNLIAECGAGAGLGIKAALSLDDRPIGKVTVLGTPAEEGGGGKILLLEGGALKGVDVALISHPYPFDVARCTALAMLPVTINYTGKAAHAAAYPWKGVNALDAAVMCYNSVSVMRQQCHPDWRVHGVFTKGGGQPNIIPEEAELSYYIRAPDQEQLDQLKVKVEACANGAAVSTGCQVKLTYGIGYANMVHNDALSTSHEKHCEGLGLVYPPERFGDKGGSIDMGNISYVIPSIHPKFAIPSDACTHNPGFTKWAGKPEAQAPTLIQAKAMALVALDVMDPNSDLLQRAKKEFEDTVLKPGTS